jgi:enoyl-CoA hydratase/carnithine racemase
MSSGPFKIGLNETQLGIAAPLWFAETMTAIVGQRQTEKLLQVLMSRSFAISCSPMHLNYLPPAFIAVSVYFILTPSNLTRLQLGTMLSAEEAAKIGLVDDVVAPELVFDKSVEVALKFAALPRDARHKSKVITVSRSRAFLECHSFGLTRRRQMVLRQRAYDFLLENR